MSVFAISNARNLARALSLGCLGPRALYGPKYERDGCELAAGRMPLFSAFPEPDVLEAVADPARLVVVELALHGEAQIDAATDAVIPIDGVVRLHFSTESERLEFISTPFDNVDPTRIEAVVSDWSGGGRAVSQERPPTLGRGPDGPGVLSGDERPSTLTVDQVEEWDRRLGAVAELLVLDRWDPDWLETLRSLLHEASQGGGVVEAPTPAGVDQQAIMSVEAALIAHPHGTTATRALVDEVAAAAPADWPHELDRVKRVLRSREVFGHISSWSDPLSAALCIALLRSSPEAVRDHLRFAPSQEVEVLRLALWLAGMLRGMARRPLATRRPEVEPVLHAGLANSLNSIRGVGFELPSWELTVTVSHADGERELSLQVGSRPLLVHREEIEPRQDLLQRVPLRILADWLGVPIQTIVRAPEVSSASVQDDQIVFVFEGVPVQLEHEVDRDRLLAELEDRDVSELQQLVERWAEEDL